jgi:hypothetical protein
MQIVFSTYLILHMIYSNLLPTYLMRMQNLLKMTRIKIICNEMKIYTKWKCLKTFNLPPSISLYSNIIFLSHFEFLQAHNLTFKYALSYEWKKLFCIIIFCSVSRKLGIKVTDYFPISERMLRISLLNCL